MESTSQAALEPMQELLTVHGTTQGESSDAVSIYTASTSVSGNGRFLNFKVMNLNKKCVHENVNICITFRVKFK